MDILSKLKQLASSVVHPAMHQQPVGLDQQNPTPGQFNGALPPATYNTPAGLKDSRTGKVTPYPQTPASIRQPQSMTLRGTPQIANMPTSFMQFGNNDYAPYPGEAQPTLQLGAYQQPESLRRRSF